MARAFKGTFELNKYLENISVAELFDSWWSPVALNPELTLQ
jgi:hypothetical protein